MYRAVLIFFLTFALPALTGAVAAATDPPVPTPAEAGGQPLPAEGFSIADFKWMARLVVVFADTPLDPSYTRQLELLAQQPDALVERDVIVLTDADPATAAPIRTALRPRGFALVIVDKDGKVMLRKPVPWDVREIARTIDRTPLRRQEMRDLRDAERARQQLP